MRMSQDKKLNYDEEGNEKNSIIIKCSFYNIFDILDLLKQLNVCKMKLYWYFLS